MNNFLLYAALFLGIIHRSGAQQIPIFTQYRENAGIINPAALSSDFLTDKHNLEFGASFRKQWIDLPNAPTTQILQGSYLNNQPGGISLLTGGYLINDQTGPTGFTGAYVRLGGVISSDVERGGLSIALAGGLVQYGIKTSSLILKDPNDVLGTQDRSQVYPDASLGAFYYQQLSGALEGDYIYSGVSIPQIMALDLSFANAKGTFYTKQVRQYYGVLGWLHYVDDQNSFIESSCWFKYAPNIPMNVDFNLRYQMQGSFWIGGGVTPFTKLHAEAGFLVGKNMGFDSNFKVGYSYDYALAAYGPYVGSTHEINVSFSLPK